MCWLAVSRDLRAIFAICLWDTSRWDDRSGRRYGTHCARVLLTRGLLGADQRSCGLWAGARQSIDKPASQYGFSSWWLELEAFADCRWVLCLFGDDRKRGRLRAGTQIGRSLPLGLLAIEVSWPIVLWRHVQVRNWGAENSSARSS